MSSRRGKHMSRKGSSDGRVSTEQLRIATEESEVTSGMQDLLHKQMDDIVNLSTKLIPAADTEDERNRMINSCEMNLKSLIIDEMVFLKANKVSEDLAQEAILQASQNATSSVKTIWAEIDNIEKETNKVAADYRSNIKEKDIQAHPMFKKLTQKISEILVSAQLSPEHEGEDCNASLIGEDHIPTIDPITKRPLIDPIKNSICGHVYGQSAIEQLIKSSGRKIRCPSLGCSNKDFIQKKHLIEDTALAAKIRNKIAKESQAGSSQGFNNTIDAIDL